MIGFSNWLLKSFSSRFSSLIKSYHPLPSTLVRIPSRNMGQSYKTGVARLFCSRAKFENYFSIGATVFKITYNFCEALNIDLFEKKYVHFLYKIVLIAIAFKLFAFQSNKKGPRAVKISWRAACGLRAALWPCLL